MRKKNEEKGLNIKHHDVNPEENYTVFPRSIPKEAKMTKGKLYFVIVS